MVVSWMHTRHDLLLPLDDRRQDSAPPLAPAESTKYQSVLRYLSSSNQHVWRPVSRAATAGLPRINTVFPSRWFQSHSSRLVTDAIAVPSSLVHHLAVTKEILWLVRALCSNCWYKYTDTESLLSSFIARCPWPAYSSASSPMTLLRMSFH